MLSLLQYTLLAASNKKNKAQEYYSSQTASLTPTYLGYFPLL